MPRRGVPVGPELTATVPAPSEEDATLSSRVLAFIESRLDPSGEVVVPSPQIAEALGARASTVTYHLKRLVARGKITTAPAGRRGTRIRLAGHPVADGGRRRSAPLSAGQRAAVGELHFCPYCGQKVGGPDWAFCGRCGHALH